MTYCGRREQRRTRKVRHDVTVGGVTRQVYATSGRRQILGLWSDVTRPVHFGACAQVRHFSPPFQSWEETWRGTRAGGSQARIQAARRCPRSHLGPDGWRVLPGSHPAERLRLACTVVPSSPVPVNEDTGLQRAGAAACPADPPRQPGPGRSSLSTRRGTAVTER